MSDGDALLWNILNNPADDTARLVFADYLVENGEESRADFIRLQIELARVEDEQVARAIGITTARRETESLRQRIARLFRWNAPRWFEHLPGSWRTTLEGRAEIQTAEGWNYVATRGFISWVDMSCATFVEKARGLFGAEPVTDARLLHKRPFEAAEGWTWDRVPSAADREAHALPPELFDLLPVARDGQDELAEECRGYPTVVSSDEIQRPVALLYLTPTRAERALIRVLVPFGRSRARLPVLPAANGVPA